MRGQVPAESVLLKSMKYQTKSHIKHTYRKFDPTTCIPLALLCHFKMSEECNVIVCRSDITAEILAWAHFLKSNTFWDVCVCWVGSSTRDLLCVCVCVLADYFLSGVNILYTHGAVKWNTSQMFCFCCTDVHVNCYRLDGFTSSSRLSANSLLMNTWMFCCCCSATCGSSVICGLNVPCFVLSQPDQDHVHPPPHPLLLLLLVCG